MEYGDLRVPGRRCMIGVRNGGQNGGGGCGDVRCMRAWRVIGMGDKSIREI